MFGLGTYKLKDETLISCALKIGYNFIDTAELYRNEQFIINAIKKSEIDPNTLFISTKIAKFSIKHKKIEESFNERISLFTQLGPSFKLFTILLHHPSDNCLNDWDILSKLYIENKDKIQYIGVSNYSITDLEQIKFSKYNVPIYCNQIEISPFCYPKELINYCNEKDIKVIAHTSLTRGEKFDNKILKNISKKYEISVAKLLLLWALYHNFIIIPKSSEESQLIENFTVHNDKYNIIILDSDIEILDSLNEDFRLTKIT